MKKAICKLYRWIKRVNADNNSGFSLVEMIVSLLVMMMVAGMIGIFVNISTISYRTILRFNTLETEAQTATDFMTEVLLSAEDCGIVNVSDGRCIWIKLPSVRYPAGKYGMILWKREENTIRYAEKDAIYIGASQNLDYQQMVNDIYGDEYSLLASLVDDVKFETKTEKGATGQLCTVQLAFRFLPTDDDSLVYNTTFKVVNRNAEKN